MMFAACTPNQNLGTGSVGHIPNAEIPETVYANVAAGDVYELSFHATHSWKLSMSQEAMAYFYFLESEDSTSATYSLRGEAGEHVVKVKVAAIQEYDQERVCEITMEMGVKKGVICKLTRTSVSRNVVVYEAQSYDDEANDFAKDADGNYLYGSDDITKLSLHYDAANNVYKQRIQTVANCVWELIEKPNWLAYSADKTTEIGTTEISMLSIQEERPYQQEMKRLVFADCSDPQNKIVLKTISVIMPGCESYLQVSLPKNMQFDGDGEYNNNGNSSELGAIGSLNAPKGAQIYKASKNGEIYDVDDIATSWIMLENDAWDEGASDVKGIWTRSFHVRTAENDGTSAREGMLIILPQSLAKKISSSAELFNSTRTEVKPEYAEYVYNITQTPLSVSMGLFSIRKVTDNMVEVGAELSDAPDWTYSEIGKCEKAFQLLYTKAWSSDGYYLNPNFEYDKIVYMAWNAGGGNYSIVTPDKSWLSYSYIQAEEIESGYRVEMDKTKAQLNVDSGAYEGFIIFKKDNAVVTFLYCVYNENITVGGGDDANIGEISLVDEAVAAQHGVTLTQIDPTSADYNKDMGKDYGIEDVPHQYRLTYTSREALANPQYAAMNISGFSYGQAVGEYTYEVEQEVKQEDGSVKTEMVKKTGYYSQMLTVEKNADLGGVVIYPNNENGFDAETIPADKYEIWLFGSSYAPIARIILDVVAQ